jgi:hypothetical protein
VHLGRARILSHHRSEVAIERREIAEGARSWSNKRIGWPAESTRADARARGVQLGQPMRFGLVRRDGGEHAAYAKRFIAELGP